VRNGEPCVCKWFKSGHVDQASFFDLDIKAMDKAHDLVREWNNRNLITKLVKVNIPESMDLYSYIGTCVGEKNSSRAIY
jgi:hypothetical protein